MSESTEREVGEGENLTLRKLGWTFRLTRRGKMGMLPPIVYEHKQGHGQASYLLHGGISW